MFMNSNQKAIISNILNNQKIIIVGLTLIILALLGGVFLLTLMQKGIKTTTVTSEKPIVTPTPIQGETIMVTFTRFVPNTLTVKKGKEINFVNFSGQDIHIDSVETEKLRIGAMKDNDTSIPIQLVPGTYTYFNKLKPEQKGTIIVAE